MNYPWQHVKPKDYFILRESHPLSDQDVRVLTTIYQPLIGNAAYALYMLLKESLQSSAEWTSGKPLSELLTILDMGIPELYQARIRLEGLGLLSVYKSKKEADQYLFELKPPLTAAQFFNDHMMKLILFEKVGEKTFKDIRRQFTSKEPLVEEYEEITKSFLDVYHFNIQKHNQLTTTDLEKDVIEVATFSAVKEVAKQSDFDWSFFIEGLNNHFIDKKSITNEIKEIILSLHEIYGLDEMELQKYVLQATDIESSIINGNKLSQEVQQDFHRKRANKVQFTDKVDQTIKAEKTKESNRRYRLSQSGFNDHEIEVILHAEEVKPGEYLSSIKAQKGGFVSSNELYLIKELIEQSSLPTSVINMLINYVLIGKNAPVLEKSLALKVANDWAISGITSPEEALKKVKQLYTDTREAKRTRQSTYSSKTNNKKAYIKKETLPKWATEENKGEEVDKEKQEEFRKRLERIRNRKKGGGE